MTPEPDCQIMVVDASYAHSRGVAGLGVAFKGGRVVCGEIVPAVSAGIAEILAVLRAAEIASQTQRFETVIFSDSTLAVAVANGEVDYGNEAGEILRTLLLDHSHVTVEWRPRSFVRSAHILARQTLKAWFAGESDGGFTWSFEDVRLEAVTG